MTRMQLILHCRLYWGAVYSPENTVFVRANARCRCEATGGHRTSDSQVSRRRHGVHLRLHGAHVLPRVLHLDVPHHQVARQPLSTRGGGQTGNRKSAKQRVWQLLQRKRAFISCRSGKRHLLACQGYFLRVSFFLSIIGSGWIIHMLPLLNLGFYQENKYE